MLLSMMSTLTVAPEARIRCSHTPPGSAAAGSTHITWIELPRFKKSEADRRRFVCCWSSFAAPPVVPMFRIMKQPPLPLVSLQSVSTPSANLMLASTPPAPSSWFKSRQVWPSSASDAVGMANSK